MDDVVIELTVLGVVMRVVIVGEGVGFFGFLGWGFDVLDVTTVR